MFLLAFWITVPVPIWVIENMLLLCRQTQHAKVLIEHWFMTGCHLFVSGDVEHRATSKTCCSRKACCNYLYQQGTEWFLLMNI